MITIPHLEPSQEPQDSVPALLDLAEVSKILGISKWTIYELMHRGILLGVKIQSRRFITRVDLDAYVEQLRAEAGERHGL